MKHSKLIGLIICAIPTFLLSQDVIVLKNSEQSKGKDTLQKCKLINWKSANRKPQGAGPFKSNPDAIKKNNSSSDVINIHHNEQDDFRRPDSVKYQPAPINKNDSSKNQSYYENNIDQNQFASKSMLSNPSVVFGFDANWCTNNTPPDNALAISNGGFIISAINCRLDIYNSSGNWLSNIDYQTFFNAPTNNFSDPRVIYDMYSDRFIFFIQYGSDPASSRIYVAFSTSNDPTKQWWSYYFDIGTANGLVPNYWFDYPSVGINQTDFCMSGNIFTSGNKFSTNLLILFNKQDGYNGVANLRSIYWTGVTDGGGEIAFTIVPATAGQNISYNNVFYLVSSLSGGGDYLTKYTINGNANNTASTISATKISTSQSYYPSSSATQPSGKDLANYKAGCRIQSAIYLNSTISFVYTANYNTGGVDYNSVYYNRIIGTKLNQSWSFLGGSNYNYPSLASFGTNSTDLATILCFLKSDNSTYPEIRFKYFDNAMNQLASSQARKGDASVYYSFSGSQQRWGDYTGTQRRYNASQPQVWISGSFGNSSNNWQTSIAEITGYPGNVSIEEVTLNNENLIIYPNPVTSQLYIKGDFKSTKYFPELYNIEGKLLSIDVTRKNNEMFQVDVSWLPKGAYLIKFQNSQTIKFVKN